MGSLSRLWGGFKEFRHTIICSAMHFKQFQDDLVEKKRKGKKKTEKIDVGILRITVIFGDKHVLRKLIW